MGEVCRCAHCGYVIGVYEPLAIVAKDGTRHTTLEAEPQRSHEHDVTCCHRACHGAASKKSAERRR